MSKPSRYDLALQNIDAKLGTLRDVASFIDEHGDKAKAYADTHIEQLQYARNLLTGASSESGEAKPKRTRRKKGLPEPKPEATA